MNIIELSTIELAAAIRSKKVSSEEVVLAYINQINRVNPTINAVVQFNPERALAEACKLDDLQAKGTLKGPLHGVPFSMKDVFNTEGDIVTAGSLGLVNNIAKEDCVIAKRLKDAGAILLGKTNTSEMEAAPDADNLVYGMTSNPYNLGYSAGGSSGGSAAIVAACGSAFSIGADLGGSLRIPAHYCGITSIRPTPGRIPTTGVVYGQRTGLGGIFTTEGPMARSVDDLELILKLICGPDGVDPKVVPVPLHSLSEQDVSSFKIAYFDYDGNSQVTPETKATIQLVAKVLADIGADVQEDKPKLIGDGFQIFKNLMGANAVNGVESALKQLQVSKVSGLLKEFLVFVNEYTCDLPTFMARWDREDQYRSDILQFMQHYDVMICPVTAKLALPNHTPIWDPEFVTTFSYCWEVSITLLPSVVVRCGTGPGGLPIGLQIIAKPWREDLALAVAKILENSLGGWEKTNL